MSDASEPRADELRERGREVRVALWGPGTDDAVAAGPAAELAPELNAWSDEVVFGQAWRQDGLEMKHRSLVTIAALVALGGREKQLRAHVAGGLRLGLTRDEIVQAIVHLAFYAGLPAAHSALEAVRDLLADQQED